MRELYKKKKAFPNVMHYRPLKNASPLPVKQLLLQYADANNIFLNCNSFPERITVGALKKEVFTVFFDLLSEILKATGVRAISVDVQFGARKYHGDERGRVSGANFVKIGIDDCGDGLQANEFSQLLHRFCESPGHKIRRAKMTTDLSRVKVFFGLSGGAVTIENVKGLKGARGFIRLSLLAAAEDSGEERNIGIERPPLRTLIESIQIHDVLCRDTDESISSGSHEVLHPQDRDQKFLATLMGVLETNISDPDFSVSKLAVEIGMSRPVLFRKAKILTGCSIINLIKSKRLKKAESLLRENAIPVSEVAFQVGYSDPKYFSKAFRNEYGITPAEYVRARRV